MNTENKVYEEVLDDLFEIGAELNALKNVYKIQKIGFLIDSSIR